MIEKNKEMEKKTTLDLSNLLLINNPKKVAFPIII